jgi:hypothetical protein
MRNSSRYDSAYGTLMIAMRSTRVSFSLLLQEVVELGEVRVRENGLIELDQGKAEFEWLRARRQQGC